MTETGALDGFSPLSLISAELDPAPDRSSLPMTIEQSVDPLATVGLFDLTFGSATFGARVPFQPIRDVRQLYEDLETTFQLGVKTRA